MPNTTFGGAFVRASDPEVLYQWYERHLGLVRSQGACTFPVQAQSPQVLFVFFGEKDAYFPPSQKVMFNLQVADLDRLLDNLAKDGVTIDPKREDTEYGKFAWIADPEGNRIELWQPASA